MPPLRRTLVVLSLLLLSAGSAAAAPTALDRGFGGDGRVASPLPALSRFAPPVTSYAVDAAGRILVLATGEGEHPLVFRYLPDGTPDPAFGTDGVVSFPNEGRAEDVAVDSRGRVIVVGIDEPKRSSFIACLREDGSFDEGILIARKPKYMFAVAVDALDRILVAGAAANAAVPNTGGAVARYQPDGSEDPSFAAEVETHSRAEDLLIDPAGRILITGYTRVTPSDIEPQVRRLLPDGALDPSFGSGGERLLPKRRFARNRLRSVGAVSGNDLAVDSRGRILISVATNGPQSGSRGSGFGLVRLRPGGDLDPGFGNRGRVLYAMTPHVERESSVSLGLYVDGRDRPVVGGTVAAGSRKEHPAGFGLMRLKTDGRPDASFAPHGRLSFRFGRISAAGGAPVPLGGRRILLVG